MHEHATSRNAYEDEVALRSAEHFRELVESVGVKRFARSMGLSTRQVNRILSGAQPNPIERLVRCLQAAEPEAGDRALDYVCREIGGYLIRSETSMTAHAANAVKESAEAIAAISDGTITDIDESEIREAIAALIALNRRIAEHKGRNGDGPIALDTFSFRER